MDDTHKIRIQDITAEDGVSAIGLFYIIGQVIYESALQLAISTILVASIPQPLQVMQYFKFHKA